MDTNYKKNNGENLTMNINKILIIYNHPYHLNKLSDKSNYDLLNVGNDSNALYTFPMIETLSFWQILKKRNIIIKSILNILKNYKQILIFGCQEYLSWFIYNKSIELNKEIKIIPDNLEFYLRPSFFKNKNLKLKQIIKILLYNLYKYSYSKDYTFFGNRLIFNINPYYINHDFSFLKKNKTSKKITDNKKYKKVYISQPYYIDYSIDLNLWVKRLKKIFIIFKNNNEPIYIKFHQRDSNNFKEKIQNLNIDIREYNEENKLDVIYMGFFSTYLFELVLKDELVFSYFNQIEDLFPNYYCEFVKKISMLLKLNLKGFDSWKLYSNSFEILNSLLTVKKDNK